jgi:hypothetical protein
MRYAYPTCHFWVSYANIEQFNIYMNNLPKSRTAQCYLSPVKALPLVKARIRKPSITISDKTITFPVELESGDYLEFHPPDDCRVYDATGEEIAQVKPEGNLPEFQPGDNGILFDCANREDTNWRGRITIMTEGPPLK